MEFWLDWFYRLGPEYGALIFSALALHGIEVAMEHLPELTADSEALNWISIFLPNLEEKWGRQNVASGIHAEWSKLSDEARIIFLETYGEPTIK